MSIKSIQAGVFEVITMTWGVAVNSGVVKQDYEKTVHCTDMPVPNAPAVTLEQIQLLNSGRLL
jgi:hypothetical protein